MWMCSTTVATFTTRAWAPGETRPGPVSFTPGGAEAGNAGAQMNLSAYYFEGLGGLRRDLAKALDWVKKADNQGEPGAAGKVTAITKIMKSGKK